MHKISVEGSERDSAGNNVRVLPLAEKWPMHAEGDVTFLTHEEGGRSCDQQSGYPYQLHYEGLDWDSIVTFEGGVARRGVPTHFWMHLTNPDAQKGRMHPGTKFEFRDGLRIIAHGIITATYF